MQAPVEVSCQCDADLMCYHCCDCIQELEKFKFVLDYKIKELKKQIEPKEEQITDMKDQVKVRATLCYVALCCAVLCCAVLCCAVLC